MLCLVVSIIFISEFRNGDVDYVVGDVIIFISVVLKMMSVYSEHCSLDLSYF
jgi:hypothetical protein